MAQPQPERRTTQRFPLRLPVIVRDSHRKEIPTYSHDVSSRGICFFLDAPIVVGTDLRFILVLPPEVTLTTALRVRCTGHVVRVESAPTGARYTVAAVIDRYEFLADRN
jgi:hypothetical protein